MRITRRRKKRERKKKKKKRGGKGGGKKLITYLCGNNNQKARKKTNGTFIESFNDGNNPNSISIAVPKSGPSVRKDGDENVFLDVEGTGVKAEFPTGERQTEQASGKSGGHESPHRQSRHLRRNGRDGERFRAECEELVEKRQQNAH